MIVNILSFFRSAGPAIANHFWQSTVFVIAVGFLTLLFGENRARVRYRLWLAASIKFLIPFSALIALGSVIPESNHSTPVLQPPLISAVQAATEPFNAVASTNDVHAQNILQRAEAWLPAALALIWIFGAATVLLAWYARWRHISKVLQSAVLVESGRELEMLRRVENNTRVRTRTQFVVSSDLVEPGVFGIFHPVLLWPARLSDRLDDAHLEAILAHEIAHVNHRDNLAALLHMAVEAIFWFHPFVWWIEHRLLEERERACDEAVVQFGSQPEIYADGLLRVSRFCTELPLPCVSGITGADLSKRIRAIMTSRAADLGILKRMILATLALGIVAGPIAFGLMQQASPSGQILHATGPLPSFEVVSIKPSQSGSGFTTIGAAGIHAPKDRFVATNITAKMLIGWAFAGNSIPLPPDQVSGGPSWVNSDKFDVDAKLEDSQVAALANLSSLDRIVQIRLMVQSLLADRFKLVVNDATVTRPVYALVIAKDGPKLKETGPCSTPPPGIPPPPPPPPPPGSSPAGPQTPAKMSRGGMFGAPGEMIGCETQIRDFARALSLQGAVDRAVLDQTGLKGTYNFDLKWTPDINLPKQTPGQSSAPETPASDTEGPSIFTAIQEQLGLKLESTKGPQESLAIVHIEKPTEN